MKKLYGKPPADKLLSEIAEELKIISSSLCFAIIQIGENPASSLYISYKMKKAAEIGMQVKCFKFPDFISFLELKKVVLSLNKDKNMHGIIVQLPIPIHLKKILECIDASKDIDGLSVLQQGRLVLGLPNSLAPCTAFGVLYLLRYYNLPLESKKIAILGRSNLVSKPLFSLFLQENAFVTVMHSKVKLDDLTEELRSSDVVCAAIGQKYFIKPDMIREGVILIDIGVTKESDKIYGDIDPACYDKSLLYTPNPYGVGPMTVASLLYNVLRAYQLQQQNFE